MFYINLKNQQFQIQDLEFYKLILFLNYFPSVCKTSNIISLILSNN